MRVYVVDVDSVLDGSIRAMVERGEIRGKIVILKSLVEYFHKEASSGRSLGYTGLEELRRLLELQNPDVEVSVVEDEKRSPKDYDVYVVKTAIRDYAWRVGATLVTSDSVQASTAGALGLPVIYSRRGVQGRLKFESFFDSKTMSVHLKEGAPPLAKVGAPGRWVFVKLREEPMKASEIEEMAREIVEVASRGGGFVEIDRLGSTIVQLGDYRIIITRPPLSNGWEITAVRPLVKLRLEDYNLPEKLLKRLIERAEGILIAGAPGMGKTTFAQALAEFYARQGKIVKTVESPRDMRLPPIVTQYSKSYADIGELHDILLLSRPDYTVFDELRTDEDFKLYVDLRLAGIGMVGVLHATSPIDGIQRFIRRVELGMIPSIIDTVIFINEGRVDKVYEISIRVKLPTGLKEAELTRPVVEVKDFLSGDLEYEIYTFGEQTMVIPVKSMTRPPTVEDEVRKVIPEAKVEVREGVLIVRLPRLGGRITARKVKRVKRIAEEHGLELRFTPE
ncbi:MAG: Flp pilus assembly complex ATPase component TadA [Desulfurococcaceae archaeon]|nr:Flp pilus assembly complex ATPase component TadA [Desulfurococcaceae archaeon]MCC6060195.1 Flp pilus assembly complex ATPase component TadA [Desulfurococcaceae archaeon]